ncbi:MAG: carboxypeptidase-like regulatory domain-containing protein [Saprospiraceae bacterium]|nr:carboxypeptidase-like regulatory domain-containing protein [Saprospiraceae bacterium]
MPNVKFGCSQQDLYTGGRIFWQSYDDYWEDFAAYSPQFTEDYSASKRAALDAAERLPDKAARQATATEVLRKLGELNKVFLYNYQLFKSYVLRIYDPSVRDLKLAAIGDSYFAKASGGTWGNTSALIGQAVPFMEDNTAELMAKNVIPADFPAKLVASGKAFSAKYTEYAAALKSADNATAEKAAANNDAYDAIADVAKAAAIIYKNDPAMAKLFIWATVVSQTHGARPSGVSGRVTLKDTKMGLKDVTIRIVGTDIVLKTDDKGRYSNIPLSSGEYIIEVEKAGYEKQTIKFKIATGVVSRVNVGLVAQAAA